jgi:uncharacterized membrane protein YciS (DUF1049 family)
MRLKNTWNLDIMKNNKYCKSESQPAQQFNANPIRLILGLCVVLAVSAISVRANDNPAQAAARVALEQKMYELDHAQTLPPPVRVTLSQAAVKQPVKYAANVTGTVSPKAVIPQTAPASATPVAASVAVAPVAVAPAAVASVAVASVAVAPAAVAPAAVAPRMLILLLSLLILACIILSLLLLKLRLQNSRYNQDLTSDDTYYAQPNRVTLRLKTGNR